MISVYSDTFPQSVRSYVVHCARFIIIIIILAVHATAGRWPPQPTINIGGLLLKKEEFQLRLQNRFEVLNNEGEDDVEEMVDRITNTIQESALATAGRHREQKNVQD